MNTVTFQNKGLIDLTSIKTFGVSVKDTDNPFGYFGTGLKYAIAILLRENCSITIHRGLTKYQFSKSTVTVRGKQFEIITMNNEKLSFTLDLGKNWELWQAYRELYCNTIDEAGIVSTDKLHPVPKTTTIEVIGDNFFNEHINRSENILESTPDYKTNFIEITDRVSKFIYFKGIRVAQLETPSLLTYNFLNHVDLTEDRTIKNLFFSLSHIRSEIMSSDNEILIRRFITAPEGTQESLIDMDYQSNAPSNEFMEVINSLSFKFINNASLRRWLRKIKHDISKPHAKVLTNIEEQQLDKAIVFLKSLDYPVDKFPICVTDELPDSTLGMAHSEEIFLSRRIFMQGTKQVAATLLEEFLHLEHGLKDKTYSFQTYLLDTIISFGEQINGEPL